MNMIKYKFIQLKFDKSNFERDNFVMGKKKIQK
jgi:hypothetical protein